MKNTVSLLWVARKIRKRIPALVLLTAVNISRALLAVAFALGSQQVIDSAISADRGTFLRACMLQGSIILGLILSLAFSRHLNDRLSADLDRDWKKQLLHSLLHGSYSDISRYHSGELLNRLNNDVRILDSGILSIIPNLSAMVTKLVAAAAVLISMEPRFALLLFLAGIVVIVATGLMRRRLKELNKRVSESEGKVSGFIQETLEKLLMVQAMDVSDEMERRCDRLLEDRFEIQRKRKNVSLFSNTCISVMFYGAGFLALIWCASGLMDGRITFGTLTAIIHLVNQVQAPFTNLSGIMPQYIAMTAAAERLMELETLEAEEAPISESPHRIYRHAENIMARDLSFRYDRDQIFENASFSLPKGAFAVITGPSGIGKSTLLKLLLGIYRPDSGSLNLDTPTGELPLDRSTRRLFAYVPQGNLLLSGTLRENLTLANPDASDEDIRQALYVSAMDDYLHQLPNGLDTLLGESGAGLSEGQAQRLAIARAIISGAPILLLDECTSALDIHTEQVVLQRIRALNDRTCIAVTHRPAAMELCDWNLEMRDGKIHAVRTK